MNTLKIASIATAVFAALALVQPSSAQDGSTAYAGIGYAQVDFDDLSGKPGMTLGIVGTPVGEYFAVEGRFGFGVRSVTESTFTGTFIATAEVKIKSYYGGFVRGILPAGENFNLYGILGYGTGKAEVSTNFGVSDSSSESSEAFGVGAEFVLGQNKEHHLGFEWAKYFEDTTAISAIYRYKF